MADVNWEHFHHQADIGVRGYGNTLDQAFTHGAMAMMAVMCDLQAVKGEEEVVVECELDDVELLFVEWLNRILFEIATRNMLFSSFDVIIEGCRLKGYCRGEGIDLNRHDIAVEVKAATYAELMVERSNDGRFLAQCIVDV